MIVEEEKEEEVEEKEEAGEESENRFEVEVLRSKELRGAEAAPCGKEREV